MTTIQSDTGLAGQHATALSAANSGAGVSVSRDERTTVAGNQTASATIDDLISLQEEISGLVQNMMGNINSLAAEFETADQQMSQGFR